MTQRELERIAREQSALHMGCEPSDFDRGENVFVQSRPHPQARKYLKLPLFADLCTYGGNVVASASGEGEEVAREYLRRWPAPCRAFETPQLLWLGDRVRSLGYMPCFLAEYFLPRLDRLTERECPYPLRVLEADALALLPRDVWHNALSEDRPQLDVLGVGAFEGDRLVGLAACSADCDAMWQIGVDVLEPYRRQGVASAATSRLALEIVSRGKVPFYCSAWANLRSVKNALASGFAPAWCQMTVTPAVVAEGFLHSPEEE